MDVGIGLPATIPGVSGQQIIEWARRAEGRGFSTLGTIDRVVYGNDEPLVTLAAAAAVTGTIKLATTVLLAPLRANAALLAKQAASVDHISNGRLVLGIAVGGREDDYDVSGVDFHTRGRRFNEQLETFARVWSGEAGVGPAPPRGRPAVLIGGQADAAFRRAARHGDGWIMGGGAPDQFREGKAKLEAAWEDAGRDGAPRTASLAYFALGDGAEQAADSYLHDYYGFLGEIADMIASSAATDAETVRGYVAGFTEAGCDELILFPCSPDPGQVDLLADALA